MTTYNKYNNGLIYKISCKDKNINDSYIGSTINFFKRERDHKSATIIKNVNLYTFIRSNGGWNNFMMTVILYYPCNNKIELHKKERELIEFNKTTLNMVIPTRTKKEHYEANREKILKEKKEYRILYPEKDKQYRDSHKEELKLYAKKHENEIKQYKKEYYEKNKESIALKGSQKFICTKCGFEYTHYNKARHEKSARHINTIL